MSGNGEVAGLYATPFTGGLPLAHDALVLNAGGPEGHRAFVAYDPDTGKVISQRKCNALYGAIAVAGADGSLDITWRDGSRLCVPAGSEEGLLVVTEYDGETPVHDLGNSAAEAISTYTNRTLRLARKTQDWMDGHGTPPAGRTVAPLHLVFEESAHVLAALAGADFGFERFQGNIVVRGFAPFEENGMVGHRVRIGEAVAKITKLTERCAVPSHDPLTGENLGDVAPLYPRLVKGERGKPGFGLYAVAELEPGDPGVQVRVGNKVEVID